MDNKNAKYVTPLRMSLNWEAGAEHSLDRLIIALIIFVLLDSVVALVYEWHQGHQGKRKFESLPKIAAKIAMTFCVVLAAHVIDSLVLHDGHLVRNSACIFYVWHYFKDMLKHAEKLPLPIPKILEVLCHFDDLSEFGEESKGTPAKKDQPDDAN